MFAKLLAEAVADSFVSVGIAERADEVTDEVECLLAEPLGLFFEHPNWPSAATPGGFPFEFSVAIANNTGPVIRYAVDVTDHRRGLAGNWNRYLECAKRIVDVATDVFV